MSRGINKVILVGNLGQDPDVKYMPSGEAVCNVSVATTRSWSDKASGDKVEKTEWHRVVFFRRLAEIVGEYLHKGSQVYVEGRLQTRKWQDKNGTDHYSTEIVANDMQMLGGRSDFSSAGGETAAAPAAPGNASRAPEKPASSPDSSSNDFDDDIPF